MPNDSDLPDDSLSWPAIVIVAVALVVAGSLIINQLVLCLERLPH